jgi:two-component system, NarL family, nitrate/nitrite response regulator NarL
MAPVDTITSKTTIDRRRILIVDDHPAVRLGTRSLIMQAHPQSDIRETGNASDALAILREDKDFDLVFLDARLPEVDGGEDHSDVGKNTLKAIREMDGPPVVIMSAEDRNRELVEQMMALGAATFVPKSSPVEYTIDAIRRALSGGVWLPSELIGKGGDSPPPSASNVFKSAELPKPITHSDLGISPTEFVILRYALNGLPPKRIADILGTNHDNVRKKMGRLYEKFGTANQVSLHAYFAKTGQTLGILSSLERKTLLPPLAHGITPIIKSARK